MAVAAKRRLAILGTFDVENYGDLLFPLIARERLAGAGIEILPVSPTDVTTRYHDAIPPISYRDFFRGAEQVDGILIGGGNIIHCRDFGLPGYASTAYPALWAGATAYAIRHALPVLWNAPGVLAPRGSDPRPGWLHRVVAAADLFNVRDEDSATVLADWSGRRPHVTPDTALDLAHVWSAELLAERFSDIILQLGVPVGIPLVALHVKQRSLGCEDIASFSRALSSALEVNGAKAILLAIGRCHGDHELAKAIHRALPGQTVSLDAAESLQDIAAVISCADAYLGASLHGHITASVYGVPARVVALQGLHKFAGTARQILRSDELVTDWRRALADLPRLLSAVRRPPPAVVPAQLDHHWSAVNRILLAQTRQVRRQQIFHSRDIEMALVSEMSPQSAKLGGMTTDLDHEISGLKKCKRIMTNQSETGWDRSEVDRLIAEGAHEQAARRISIELERSPNFLPARMAEVRLEMARNNTARAIELGEILFVQRPENAWLWLLRIQSLVCADQLEDAQMVFGKDLMRLTPEEAVVNSALNALLPRLALRDQVNMLKTALERHPDSQTLQLRLAMRAQPLGDNALAIEMLRRAEQAAPLPEYARQLRSLLYPYMGTMQEASDRIAAEVEAGSSDVVTLCRLSRFASAAGHFDRAQLALHRVIELHPLEMRSLYRLNRVFLTKDEDETIHQHLSRVATKVTPGLSWQLQFVLFSLRTGHDHRGRELLTQLLGHESTGPTARLLLAALEELGPADPRPELAGDSHVRVVRRDAAQGTLVVFGGLLGGLSYLHFRLIDRLFADLPIHVVYLRDPFGCNYLNGIPELGSDEGAMRSALQSICNTLGGGPVVTLGGSGAGYSALRMGLALGARRVVSLAGFVTPTPVQLGGESRPFPVFEELFGSDLTAHDLRPELQRCSETRLIQIVGGNYQPDLDQARTLEGIANAETVVMDGVDTHHVVLPAVIDGTLIRKLHEAFSL